MHGLSDTFNRDFSIFLKNIGRADQIKYIDSMLACDGDKCTQYRSLWESRGIPYEHGVMIYLITKLEPYCEEVRVVISPCDYVIAHYGDFKKLISKFHYRCFDLKEIFLNFS